MPRCKYCKSPVTQLSKKTSLVCDACQLKLNKVMAKLPHDVKTKHPDWYEDTPAELPQDSVKGTLDVINHIAGK